MRRSLRTALAVIAISALGSIVYGQSSGTAGYLAAGELDVTTLIEPAPSRADPRFQADRAIFRQTRKFVGTPRYVLATNDVQTSPAAMLRDFSCAVGVVLTPENAPRLTAAARRAAIDTGSQAGRAKDFFRHERPYVLDPGRTCQAPAALIDQRENRPSFDYPSGHSTLGWTWALVLASVAPDRAQHVFQRGVAYGESRVVCGVHNQSAVDAGIMSASATMALVQTKPAYQADLAAARDELAALRTSNVGKVPEKCDAEAALLLEPVLPPAAPPGRTASNGKRENR